MSSTEKVYELAKFTFDRHQQLVADEGWTKIDIPFDELPEEQIHIYIGLAGSIIEFIKRDLANTSRIIT